MKKIEELTEEQKSHFDEYVQKWLKIGLSTELVDLENAKASIIDAYTIAGLPAPTNFYVVDGPLAAIKLIKTLDSSLDESTIMSQMSYGCHDASWLAFYDFMHEIVGIDIYDKIKGLLESAKYSGWMSLYDDTVVFQHRPESLKFDDRKLLHNETGPSIRYRDGLEVYSWHGTAVPKEWIMDKKNLKAETALTWANIEQRRCACEILGWANILKKLDAKIINEDADPEIGSLVEVNIPDIGKEKFLRVLCGTKREFAIPVPPEMKTAIEAQAWTWGLNPSDFVIPEVRT